MECDEGVDNVLEIVEDCVENDLEAGEDGFTIGDNGRVTSNQRTAEIVEGSINDQIAHVQQENVVNKCLKTYETPKPNMYIKFRLIGQNEWTKARVLSKQPKRTGKNKNWFNILQEGDEKSGSVEWKQVSYWEKGFMSRECAVSHRPGANESRNCRCKGKGIKEYENLFMAKKH